MGQGALDLAVRYAREREQSGRAIGSFQAVKHLLADALARVDLARAAVLVLAHLYLKRAWLHETAYGTADEHALTLAEAL